MNQTTVRLNAINAINCAIVSNWFIVILRLGK